MTWLRFTFGTRDKTYNRILVILDTYPAQSETFLYTTLEGLIDAGLTIVAVARKRGQAPHKPLSFNVRYLPEETLPLPIKGLLLIKYILEALIKSPRTTLTGVKLLKHQRSWKAFAVEAFRTLPLMCIKCDLTYIPFGGLATKYIDYMRIRKEVIFSLRGSDVNVMPVVNISYRQRLADAIENSRAVHCVCNAIKVKAEQIVGKPLTKTTVIYTAINKRFLTRELSAYVENKTLIISSVGRLDWGKGYEHGLMAIKELLKTKPNLRWHIVGDGPFRQALEWAIRDEGLEEVVILEGARDQDFIANLLRSSTVYFHPAVHEGISNAVLEAMALGLPVVATNVGGMAEAVSSGENGVLVPPRDWRMMAKALDTLASDPCLREQLGKKARETVQEKFTLERQQAEFLNLFTHGIKC